MNTVITLEQNSLEQDKSVNPEPTQFTSAQGSQNSHRLSFVSQFDTQTSQKKDAKPTDVKLAHKMFMFTTVRVKPLKELT